MLLLRSLPVLLLVALTSSTGILHADENTIAELRKELEELRRENRSLRDENNSLRTELRELKSKKSPAGSSDDSSGNDQIVGRIWEITATGPKGNKATARFLAQDGSIYVPNVDRPKVGTYVEKGPNVRIDVFDAPVREANGVYHLIQIGKTPPTYVGKATNTAGGSFKVELRMLAD